MAAGKGTRMIPLTNTTPKPLLDLQGKPILYWTLKGLQPIADRVIVVVHYLGEQIESYMKQQTLFRDYQVVYQTPQPLGTGHSLACAQPYLQSDDFVIINGDDLYDVPSLKRLAQVPLGILALYKDDPSNYAAIIQKPNGNLSHLHEKPPQGAYPAPVLVNIGAYKLNHVVFDYRPSLSERGEYELTDYISYMAQHYPMQVVQARFWMPIGYPEELISAQQLDLQIRLQY